MKLKPVFVVVVIVSGMSAASALTTQDMGPFMLGYDESTNFGGLSSTFSASGNIYGFTWTVPNSAQVASFGLMNITNVPLPSFTITANPGWALSNASAFLGNLSFIEVGGATTDIIGNANVSIDGYLPVPIGPHGMAWADTTSPLAVGYVQGYFADTLSAPVAFHSLAVTGAGIDLSAVGGTFSNISANPQSKLEISLMAVAVPEPETYAMFFAGLAALGWLSKRRRAQG